MTMRSVRNAFNAIIISSLIGTTAIGNFAFAAPGAESEGGAYGPAIASSVRVLALSSDGRATYGTGWIVRAADRENRAGASVVITARHVIAGAVKVTVIESGSTMSDQRPATVISGQVDQDIAFLEVKDLTKPALQLTRVRPDVGADVAAAGYTSASDKSEADRVSKSATLKRGGLSKYFRGSVDPRAQAPIDQVEFDAPVLAGFSGGPLLNHCGRVVGMTITDGGHIRIADGASVAIAQGVATAVAADEIIRAARAASVEIDAVDTACGATTQTIVPPPAPPPASCPGPYMSVDPTGKPCTPVDPTPTQNILHKLKGPAGFVVAAALVALLIVIGTILWLLRRRSKPSASQVFGSSEGIPAPGRPGSSLLDPGASKLRGSQLGGAHSLRLTGRGADGEPITLRFSADDLLGASVMLGTEGSPNGRIPDNRAKTLVSRKHAQLGSDGQNFTIEDNKSMNGTKVGSARLEPFTKRVIVSGDTVTLADISLHVTIE